MPRTPNPKRLPKKAQRYLRGLIAQLVARRKELGYTQDELNERMGFAERLLSKWESATTMPGAFSFYCWADALDAKLVLVPHGHNVVMVPEDNPKLRRLRLVMTGVEMSGSVTDYPKHIQDQITAKLKEQDAEQQPVVESKANKYGNENTQGYDSNAERKFHEHLILLEAGGQIKDIRRQVRFTLNVNGETVCEYIADFVFHDVQLDQQRICDVKGYTEGQAWAMFRLKQKLMLACGHSVETYSGTDVLAKKVQHVKSHRSRR